MLSVDGHGRSRGLSFALDFIFIFLLGVSLVSLSHPPHPMLTCPPPTGVPITSIRAARAICRNRVSHHQLGRARARTHCCGGRSSCSRHLLFAATINGAPAERRLHLTANGIRQRVQCSPSCSRTQQMAEPRRRQATSGATAAEATSTPFPPSPSPVNAKQAAIAAPAQSQVHLRDDTSHTTNTVATLAARAIPTGLGNDGHEVGQYGDAAGARTKPGAER